MAEGFRKRIRLYLELALLSDRERRDSLASLYSAGRSLGLSSAEIDAALTGRSFEARTNAALGLACAIKSGMSDQVEAARQRALRLGLSAGDLHVVAEEAGEILARCAP